MKKICKHNRLYYGFFLLIQITCISLISIIAMIDFTNMINNGFIHKNAIFFKVKEKTDIRFNQTNDKFILFQYDSSNPKVKYVMINQKVSMPPIKFSKKINIYSPQKNIAIIGREADPSQVPSHYQIAGHFDTPNSYKLNTEVWLIPAVFKIEENPGELFIMNIPSADPLKILKTITNHHSLIILHKEDVGTYSLHSNKNLIFSIKICLLFTFLIFLFVSVIWFSKDKHLIRVLYHFGYSSSRICWILTMQKIVPYIFIIIPWTIICLMIFVFKFSFWANHWIGEALASIFLNVLCLGLICLGVVYLYGRKGR